MNEASQTPSRDAQKMLPRIYLTLTFVKMGLCSGEYVDENMLRGLCSILLMIVISCY